MPEVDVTRHVAIIGAGFSGTMMAINLLRHEGLRATLIEKRPRAGEGLAYGDADPVHVLNVRAAGMSGFPDFPDHFVDWLANSGFDATARTFVSRKVYGSYLREMLASARAAHPDRLTVLQDTAVDLQLDEVGVNISLASGQSVKADTAVLALGNLPPPPPSGLDVTALDPDCYFGDPWSQDPAKGMTAKDRVLILGTGLTMIDMVLKLRKEGFGGQITAVSRRGLLPHRHDEQPDYEPISNHPGSHLSKLVAAVRARGREIGWRNAVDELRPFTQTIWQGASDAERARFLRHLRPWWDVHRHRIAPVVAAEIDRLRKDGVLNIVAAKISRLSQAADAVAVTLRHRTTQKPETIRLRRIINCMGPQGNLDRTDEPLLQRLVHRGLLLPDTAHLGIDVDAQCRAFDASGEVSDRLLAIGPMTRSAFWEIVAVPDIRLQTWSVAKRLSNPHRVGVEGV